jgi:hypothetical protein
MEPRSAEVKDTLVERLAGETHTPLEVARTVYEHEYEAVDRYARIKSYVPAIALRHAREVLRSAG